MISRSYSSVIFEYLLKLFSNERAHKSSSKISILQLSTKFFVNMFRVTTRSYIVFDFLTTINIIKLLVMRITFLSRGFFQTDDSC